MKGGSKGRTVFFVLWPRSVMIMVMVMMIIVSLSVNTSKTLFTVSRSRAGGAVVRTARNGEDAAGEGARV